MTLITWRLIFAGMHTRWNRETWESEIYLAYNILTGRKGPFPSDIGSRHAPPNRPLQLPRQIYFTYNNLTGRRILRLANSILIGLTDDKSPSSYCVLTANRSRITKCQP